MNLENVQELRQFMKIKTDMNRVSCYNNCGQVCGTAFNKFKRGHKHAKYMRIQYYQLLLLQR